MPKLFIKDLSLVNFKSFPEVSLTLSDNVNCFTGPNGIGKTNLLDAIYYMAFCKSFFNPIDVQNIHNEEDFFVVQGTFERLGEEEHIYCGNQRQRKKKFKRNDKEYEKLSDHIGLIPLVIVTPEDTQLIRDGSDVRRKFMDGVISQYDNQYLHHLLAYNKAVAQRNALLKHFWEEGKFDASTLEVWDLQLAEHGTPLHEARKAFLEAFIPIFQDFYNQISGKAEKVNLSYNSHLEKASFDEVLRVAIKKDRAARYTTIGIHKDDLAFEIFDRPLKKFGSQGQQKTFVTALKMAQFHFIKEKKGIKPLLLLDDIFDKLDDKRVQHIMEMVKGDEFGQIFVTDTSKERIERLFEHDPHEVRIFEFDEKANLKQPTHA